METDRIGRWVALGANLGVLAGIALLVVELQQTQQALVASAYQARTTAMEDWDKWVSESEFIAPAVLRWEAVGEFEELSPEDQYRIRTATLASFHRLDGLHRQYELDMLDAAYYDSVFPTEMRTWAPRFRETGLLDHPTVQSARKSFAEEISRYVDAELRR